jgi:hypothetical protein
VASNSTAVRRLPSCDPQPPFDDELASTAQLGESTAHRSPAGAPDHGQPSLRLVFALPNGVPAVPELPDTLHEHAAPELRLLPALNEPADPVTLTAVEPRTRRRAPGRDSADDEFGSQRTATAMLPAPMPWAGRLVQAVLEVVSGARPASQLVRWTTAPIYEALCASVTPPQTAARAGSRRIVATRFAEVVRSVHVSEPCDGVVEVCAIVQQGPRCRAIALRLEGIDGRWQCTALQIG